MKTRATPGNGASQMQTSGRGQGSLTVACNNRLPAVHLSTLDEASMDLPGARREVLSASRCCFFFSQIDFGFSYWSAPTIPTFPSPRSKPQAILVSRVPTPAWLPWEATIP